MSMLTGISGVVRATIAGQASQSIKALGDHVKSISGLNLEGSNASLNYGRNTTRTGSQNILTYPLNVDNDPQQGHYILFHINTRSNSKLKSTRSDKKNTHASAKKIQKELNIGMHPSELGDMSSVTTQALHKVDPTKLVNAKGASGRLNRSLMLEKLPTTRLEKSIALYMPPAVQVSYQTKYGEQEIGLLASVGARAIGAWKSGGDTKTKMKGVLDAITNSPETREGLQKLLESTVEGVATGSKALIALERGTVRTPRMEIMFEGVGRRNFSYSFDFTPKSEQEAKIIEEIIYNFKFYMMPKYSNPSTQREMDIPGTFDIRYMYRTKDNNFINKISTCFLTQVDVEYGGDRYTAYKETTSKFGSGPPPQKSKLTLQFNEIELITQDHIGVGY